MTRKRDAYTTGSDVSGRHAFCGAGVAPSLGRFTSTLPHLNPQDEDTNTTRHCCRPLYHALRLALSRVGNDTSRFEDRSCRHLDRFRGNSFLGDSVCSLETETPDNWVRKIAAMRSQMRNASRPNQSSEPTLALGRTSPSSLIGSDAAFVTAAATPPPRLP